MRGVLNSLHWLGVVMSKPIFIVHVSFTVGSYDESFASDVVSKVLDNTPLKDDYVIEEVEKE